MRLSPQDNGYQPVSGDGHDGSHTSLEEGGGKGASSGGMELKRRTSKKNIRRATVKFDEKRQMKQEADAVK